MRKINNFIITVLLVLSSIPFAYADAPAPTCEVTGMISEGQTNSYTVGGIHYEITNLLISADRTYAKFIVNGMNMDAITIGGNQFFGFGGNAAQGLSVGITSILVPIDSAGAASASICLSPATGTPQKDTCLNGVQDSLSPGETKTYTMNNNRYEIKNLIIDTLAKTVKFIVNGETTYSLAAGSSYTLSNNTKISVTGVDIGYSGNNLAWFCIEPSSQNTILPLVTFSSPKSWYAGLTINPSTVTYVEASASDPSGKGIQRVEFYYVERSGANTFIGSDYSAPYTATWDSSKKSAGEHSLLAIAYTTDGRKANTGEYRIKIASVCSAYTGMSTCLDNTACAWDQQTNGCIDYKLTVASCADPDGGAVASVQAHTFGYRQQCADNKDCRIRTGGLDACTNTKTLLEYTCTNGYITAQYLPCESCSNGACIQSTPTNLCTDSDGGKSYYEKGYVTYQGYVDTSGNLIKEYDECGRDTVLNQDVIKEKYCPSEGGIGLQTFTCLYGCSNGACIQSTANTTCTDTDGGKNYAVKGRISGLDANRVPLSVDDFCVNSTRLLEYECNQEYTYGIPYDCSNGCSNGACLTASQNTSRGSAYKVGDACGIDLTGCSESQKADTWKGMSTLPGTIDYSYYLATSGFVCSVNTKGVTQSWPVTQTSGWWCGRVVASISNSGQTESCIPDGGIDDTLYQTNCCSGKAVEGSTLCSNPTDWFGSWTSCTQICGQTDVTAAKCPYGATGTPWCPCPTGTSNNGRYGIGVCQATSANTAPPLIVVGEKASTQRVILAIDVAQQLKNLYSIPAGSSVSSAVLDSNVAFSPTARYILIGNAQDNTLITYVQQQFSVGETTSWQLIGPNILQITSRDISYADAFAALFGSAQSITRPSAGVSNAPVQMQVFADFQDPYTARFFSETWPTLKWEYVDTGKMRLEFYNSPLSFHPDAEKAAEAALCANDQGQFWGYHGTLVNNMYYNTSALDIASLKNNAVTMGLDAATFNTCLDSGKHAADVQRDIATGEAKGVSGIPTFFINGQAIIGAQPQENFRTMIQTALNQGPIIMPPVDGSTTQPTYSEYTSGWVTPGSTFEIAEFCMHYESFDQSNKTVYLGECDGLSTHPYVYTTNGQGTGTFSGNDGDREYWVGTVQLGGERTGYMQLHYKKKISTLPGSNSTGTCNTLYSPVCGTNGITYGNACLAGLNGVGIAKFGACPASGNGNNGNGNQGNSDNQTTCKGCTDNGLCYDVGVRLKKSNTSMYCELDKTLQNQKAISASCENNFECLSNQCSNGACVDIQKQLAEQNTLLQRILRWFGLA